MLGRWPTFSYCSLPRWYVLVAVRSVNLVHKKTSERHPARCHWRRSLSRLYSKLLHHTNSYQLGDIQYKVVDDELQLTLKKESRVLRIVANDDTGNMALGVIGALLGAYIHKCHNFMVRLHIC